MVRFITQYKKQILLGLSVLLILNFVRISYVKKYNTYINIASYLDSLTPYDINVLIDDKLFIQDEIDTIEYGFFGKIHPVKVFPGKHKIVIYSDKLNMVDSIDFYSVLYSHFYVEIGEDFLGEKVGISIDKRFGRKIIFE